MKVSSRSRVKLRARNDREIDHLLPQRQPPTQQHSWLQHWIYLRLSLASVCGQLVAERASLQPLVSLHWPTPQSRICLVSCQGQLHRRGVQQCVEGKMCADTMPKHGLSGKANSKCTENTCLRASRRQSTAALVSSAAASFLRTQRNSSGQSMLACVRIGSLHQK